MIKDHDIKKTIPLLILVIVAGIGLVLINKQNSSTDIAPTKIAANDAGGIVLGDSSNNKPIANPSAIADGQTYNSKVLEIRKPINQGFQDLSEKAKYTTLFPSEEIQKIIDDTKKNIESGIDTLTNLSIDEKLRTANDLHIKSLNLLLEAINSYNNARHETDKKEAQRLSELFSYDIEQSNNILKTIQIPN